jgi:transporter family protein
MNWLPWALLSAPFAGITAVLANAGVKGIASNLATAIRTVAEPRISWLSQGYSLRAPGGGLP